MLLTIQQEYILEVLNRVGCIRTEQLTRLVRWKFEIGTADAADRITQASLQQLRHCYATLRLEQEVVFYASRGIDHDRLEAIQIMLELGGQHLFDFVAATPPILLRFVVEQAKLTAFAVAQNSRSFLPPHFFPEEKVIILLRKEERPTPFPIENTQIFAIKQDDGTYRFLTRKTK